MIAGLDRDVWLRLQSGEARYALVGGSVFDPRDGKSHENRAVHIDGGRIVSVGDPGQLPGDLPRIAIPGCTVLPGLIDVHVHSEDWHAPLYLSKGITAVRDVGCDLGAILSRRERWNASAAAPRLVCTGPLLDGPGNTWSATTQVVQSPDEARLRVDHLVEQGVDQIKTYAFLDWPCFEAILSQAHRRGKFVVAHLGKHVNARQAVEAGLDEIEHLSGVAEALGWERNRNSANWEFFKLWASLDLESANRLIDLFLEKGTWLAITRLVWQRLATTWDSRHLSHPQMQYVPGPLREYWETFSPRNQQVKRAPQGLPPPSRADRCQQVAGMAIFTAELFRRIAHDPGARILIGTDAPFPHLLPGFSYHDEIQALLECGLDEAAALRAATLAGARALGLDHLVGTIERGKLADLVIVRGNPLEDMRALENIEAVSRDGCWLDPADLLSQAEAYARQAVPAEQKRFDNYY